MHRMRVRPGSRLKRPQSGNPTIHGAQKLRVFACFNIVEVHEPSGKWGLFTWFILPRVPRIAYHCMVFDARL